MISISYRPYDSSKMVQKNVLYRVNEDCIIQFVESHGQCKEIVNVSYSLRDKQYGVYANEFRSPNTAKEGCKTTDVLACVMDEKKRQIFSIVFDVKSNISAFSDDLTKDNAMLTAIKEVRDFIKQLHAEILHKKSFLLYYQDDGYAEDERIAIVTKHFEAEKFRAVANELEKILKGKEKSSISSLITYKMKHNLKPYESEIQPLRDFADKKVIIGSREYDLQVFLLQQINDRDYEITIELIKDTHK